MYDQVFALVEVEKILKMTKIQCWMIVSTWEDRKEGILSIKTCSEDEWLQHMEMLKKYPENKIGCKGYA